MLEIKTLELPRILSTSTGNMEYIWYIICIHLFRFCQQKAKSGLCIWGRVLNAIKCRSSVRAIIISALAATISLSLSIRLDCFHPHHLRQSLWAMHLRKCRLPVYSRFYSAVQSWNSCNSINTDNFRWKRERTSTHTNGRSVYVCVCVRGRMVWILVYLLKRILCRNP